MGLSITCNAAQGFQDTMLLQKQINMYLNLETRPMLKYWQSRNGRGLGITVSKILWLSNHV